MVQVKSFGPARARTFENLAEALDYMQPYLRAKKTAHVSAGLPPALRRRLENAKRTNKLSMAEIVRRGIVSVLR